MLTLAYIALAVNTGGSEVGISRVTEDVVKVIAQVPPVIESLTGLKLEQLLERLRPKPIDGNPAPESPQVKP